MAISKFAIHAACYRILEQSKKRPKRREVHDAVGGKCSMGTVQKYVAEWEQHNETLISATIGERDAGVAAIGDPLLAIVGQLHRSVREEASKVVEDAIMNHERELARKDAELAHVANEHLEARQAAELRNGTLEEKLDILQKQLHERAQHIALLEDELQRANDFNDKARQQLDGLLKEMAEMRRNNEELQKKLWPCGSASQLLNEKQ